MKFGPDETVEVLTGIFAGWPARIIERMPEEKTTYYVVEVEAGDDTYRFTKPENELEDRK